MIHHKNVLIIMDDHGSGVVLFFGDDYVFLPNKITMNDIPVTPVHCWISVHRSRRSFWNRVWGLDKALLKIDYLGAIPVESGAVVGDVLVDSHGQLFRVVLKDRVRNVHAYANEFHLPNSLTVLYQSYAEQTKC